MSSERYVTQRGQTYKRVDLGQAVTLDDKFLLENHRTMQLEAIALKTMENAEARAEEILETARAEAQQILAAAREKADKIVAEGERDKEAITQQGFEKGYRDGLQKGVDQIAGELADRVRMADQILEKSFEAEKLLMERQGFYVVELIQYILKLVLAHELETRPEQLTGLIGKALKNFQASGVVKIILNPETLQSLRGVAPEAMETFETLNRIMFHPDPGCGPYELYLETVETSFDISAESQAEVFFQALKRNFNPLPPGDPLPDPDFATSLLAEEKPTSLESEVIPELTIEATEPEAPEQ